MLLTPRIFLQPPISTNICRCLYTYSRQNTNGFELYWKRLTLTQFQYHNKQTYACQLCVFYNSNTLITLVTAINTQIGVLDLCSFVPADSPRMAIRCRNMSLILVMNRTLLSAFAGWYSESKLENQLSHTSKHTYYEPRDPVTQSGPHGKQRTATEINEAPYLMTSCIRTHTSSLGLSSSSAAWFSTRASSLIRTPVQQQTTPYTPLANHTQTLLC